MNLLTNAIKYSNPETTIVVRAHEKESSLHIEVADEGFGIESRHHDRLFERFYRIDSDEVDIWAAQDWVYQL